MTGQVDFWPLGNEKATQKCPFDGFVTMYLTLLILETCLFFLMISCGLS